MSSSARVRSRYSLRPVGLLGRFALASALVVALLGVVLGRTLASTVRARALDDAEQAAVLVGDSFVQPHLSAADLENGLSTNESGQLDNMLSGVEESDRIVRIKVWSPDGRVVYADDHSIIGRTFEMGDGLGEALDGEITSEVSSLEDDEEAHDRAFGKLLEVYVPLRIDGADAPVGAFEIYVPYAPVADRIANETRELFATLAVGLVLLYVALYRIMAGASRRLRQQAQENEHLALHDTLTGLPNRNLFRDRTEQAVRAARRDGDSVALLLIDLDRFKEVNDTLGHRNGDEMLVEVGERLRRSVREIDTVARLGGDEFGVVLSRVRSVDDAVALGEKLRFAISEPMILAGVLLDVDVSVGIALYPRDGDDIDVLLQRADVAMYAAKDERTGVELYRADSDEYSTTRLALVAELRRAIEHSELVLHYQPKFELATRTMTGVEALVRWQHPERGLLAPIDFVPTAERTGLIRQLTRYVLASALAQVRTWRDAGVDLSVSVNLSARDLVDVELPDHISGLLAEHDVPADRLALEITETVLLSDPVRARVVVDRLAALGITLSIDDFGTGYSSLAYLERLPVDEIKIDKSFVLKMVADDNDAVIVRSIVDLGHNLGLKVVAEGVEEEAAWTMLRSLGCDLAQGYLLARPVTPEQVPSFLAHNLAPT